MADYDEFLSFFMPESSHTQAGDKRYYLSNSFFYDEDNYDDTLDVAKQVNQKAWSDYCKGNVSGKNILASLYDTGQSLQSYLKKTKNTEALDYLAYAKELDATVSASEDYLSESTVDTLALEQLATTPLALAATTKDPFIKERYLFQAIKAVAMQGNWQEVIGIYQKNILPLKSKTYISDWALSRKAGAELMLGDSVQAFYDFAQVFDRCPSRRREADLSIRSHGIGFQEGALRLCRSNHEKAAVYAFNGIRDGVEGLDALEQIVALEPANPLVELLMAREINKNERFYYKQTSFWGEEPDEALVKANKSKALTYWDKLQAFTEKCIDNPVLPNKAYWLTAGSYLAYIEQDFSKANELLSKAKALNPANEGLKKQLLIQELLLTVNQNAAITHALEDSLVPLLEKFRKPNDFRMSNAFSEACKLLTNKYLQKEPVEEQKSSGWFSSCSSKKEEDKGSIPFATAKAYLLSVMNTYQVNSSLEYGGYMSQGDMYVIEDTTSMATVQAVIAYFEAKDKTKMDERFQQMCGFDADFLYTLLGRRALIEHNYAVAAQAWAKVNPSVFKDELWTTCFKKDPFLISPKQAKKATNPYTPSSFAAQLNTLSERLKTNPADTEAAYLLACGEYNLSYWGNAWVMTKRGRSSSEISLYSQRDKKTYEADYYTAIKAKNYFEQAMKSSDNELAAKACYGLALCESASYAIFVDLQEQGESEEYEVFQQRIERKRFDNTYTSAFSLLKSKFATTKFEDEMLKECSDYRHFVKGH